MPKGIWLLDDEGLIREEFAVGQTVFVAGRGLPANSLLTIGLEGHAPGGAAVGVARYTTDRHGTLPAATLFPQIGLLSLGEGPMPQMFEEAERTIGGRHFTLHASAARKKTSLRQKLKFTVRAQDATPRVYAADPHGRPLPGMELGEREMGVVLRSFPAGCVRVFAVRRQFGWRTGDPIEPVRTRQGAPLVTAVQVAGNGPHYVRLARAGDIGPGSYQFIARAYKPGWYEA